MRLSQSTLHRAELRRYKQLGPAGDTEENTDWIRTAVIGIHSAARSVAKAFWRTCHISIGSFDFVLAPNCTSEMYLRIVIWSMLLAKDGRGLLGHQAVQETSAAFM